MLYEIASIAYSPDPVVAVASFLNLKKVEGSSAPQFFKLYEGKGSELPFRSFLNADCPCMGVGRNH